MNYAEDFSAYINYDACDPNDAYSRAQEYARLGQSTLPSMPKYNFRATWCDVNSPTWFPNSGPSMPIHQDSSSLSPDSAWASSSSSSHPHFPSAVNPSALLTPSTYTSSISNLDSYSMFRETSPLSDSSLSASESHCSNMFPHNTSTASSPASSISSIHLSKNSPSLQRFRPLLPSTSSRLRTESSHLNTSTRSATGFELDHKDSGRRHRPSGLSTRHHRSVSLQESPTQAPPNLDDSSEFVLSKNGKKRWLCRCGKSFTRDSDRKRHSEDSTSCPLARQRSEVQNEEADPRFVCEHCTKSFSRYDSLDRHRRNRTACPGVPKKSLNHTEYRRAKRRGYEGNDL